MLAEGREADDKSNNNESRSCSSVYIVEKDESEGDVGEGREKEGQ
jgi:hypothetical protein